MSAPFPAAFKLHRSFLHPHSNAPQTKQSHQQCCHRRICSKEAKSPKMVSSPSVRSVMSSPLAECCSSQALKSAALPICAFATLLCHLCLFDVATFCCATLRRCLFALPPFRCATSPCACSMRRIETATGCAGRLKSFSSVTS